MNIDYIFKEGQKVKILDTDNETRFIKGVVVSAGKDYVVCRWDGWYDDIKYFKKDCFQILENNELTDEEFGDRKLKFLENKYAEYLKRKNKSR